MSWNFIACVKSCHDLWQCYDTDISMCCDTLGYFLALWQYLPFLSVLTWAPHWQLLSSLVEWIQYFKVVQISQKKCVSTSINEERKHYMSFCTQRDESRSFRITCYLKKTCQSKYYREQTATTQTQKVSEREWVSESRGHAVTYPL